MWKAPPLATIASVSPVAGHRHRASGSSARKRRWQVVAHGMDQDALPRVILEIPRIARPSSGTTVGIVCFVTSATGST